MRTMKKKPTNFTEAEVRKKLYRHMLGTCKYWLDLPNKSKEEVAHGITFSLLALFDGSNADMPALDIKVVPHPNDKSYCIKLGERWFKPGMIINSDTEMHSEFCSLEDQL